jgi:hypothetical protein
MERQAGLGRSLEDVLDSLAPVEPDTSTPGHALFGLVADDDPTATGSKPPKSKKSKKTKKTKQAGKSKQSKAKKQANGAGTNKKKHKKHEQKHQKQAKTKGRRA